LTGEPQALPHHRFRLACISEDHSAVAGGVPAVVDQLSRRVASCGIPINQVFSRGGDIPSREGVEANCIPPSQIGAPWGWSLQLREGIERMATFPEQAVFHLHGIWSAPQYIGAKVARERSIPFVVSAHGMLEPWLWERQGWKVRTKKRIYWKLLAYPALSAARVIHAITPLERKHLQALFPTNQIEVIPNAIDLDEYPDIGPSQQERERLILFVGRIEPKKGVDILLRAFAAARLNSDWRVVIIGPVWSLTYQAELERVIAENGLGKRITFIGPVFGEDKRRWMRKAWVLAVPSHSEVVGLVNLEAGAYCVPSITTYQTGLEDWVQGGGMLIQPDVEQMRVALEQACAWSDSERDERGRASRRLVSERYSWDAVLPQWISLYESLIVKD